MPRILIFIWFFLIFCTYDLYAQHQELLDIINSDLPKDQIQEKLDAVLITSQQLLSPKELANCYHDIGAKWYYPNWDLDRNNKDIIDAIKYTAKALDIKRNVANLETCSINKTLFNLGYFNRLNENVFEAIKIFQELDRFGTELCSEQLKDRDKVKWARYELGDLFIITGDYYKAIEVFNRIITRYRKGDKSDDNRRSGAVEANIQLAEIYFKLDPRGYLNLIQNYLKDAEALNLEKDEYFDYNMARIDNIKANCFLKLAAYNEASEYYSRVLKRLPMTDSMSKARVFSNLGYAFNMLGSFDKADNFLEQALSFNPRNGNVHNNMGDLYLGKDDFKTAFKEYNTAILLDVGKTIPLKYDQLPPLELLQYSSNKIALLNHIVTKAKAWISYFEFENNKTYLANALETFTMADQLVDLIREVSNEQETKLYWREQSSSLYMKAVEVCYLLNQPEKAFFFMERNKALLLLEDLTHEEAKNIARVPKDLAEREFILKRRILLAENSLFEAYNEASANTDTLIARVDDHKYRYQNFTDSLNTAFPEYARYKRNPVILPYEELTTDFLAPNQVALHYILNDEDGYGLLSTSESSFLFRLKDADQLSGKIEAYNALLTNGVSDILSLTVQSQSIFEDIIPGEIYDHIQGKQLIVIPDYTLQRLPFESLVVDTAQQRYLLEEVEISYVYSMSLLAHNQGRSVATEGEFLGVAPVKFNTLGLPALDGSQGEITGIAGLFESDVLLNEDATKANFLNAALNPKVIHLATHADVGQGDNPWIAFSDAKMYLKEIYATKTNSEMVVLSACNTSDGNLKRGEGIMSLARGFFYSGAKSVVSSLWPVTDASGKDIMISFYKYMDKGYSKSKALREAKLNYLNTAKATELKHPFYWAGYIVVGDNTPLITSSFSFWTYAGIVLLLVLIYAFRKKLFKRLQ